MNIEFTLFCFDKIETFKILLSALKKISIPGTNEF